jgi:hypothetical protein
MQNASLRMLFYNIKPQYTITNDLIYKYDKETQFGQEMNIYILKQNNYI